MLTFPSAFGAVRGSPSDVGALAVSRYDGGKMDEERVPMSSDQRTPHPLFGAIASFRRRRALNIFMRKLPRHLYSDYQFWGVFTAAQVEATIRRHMPKQARQAHLAVAIFCDPDAARDFWRDKRGGLDEFDRSRLEIGASYFNSYDDFSSHDLERQGAGHFGFGPMGIDPGNSDGEHH